MVQVTRRLSGLSFSALALVGVVACGGSDANTQPQTPATTTTTGATPAVADPSGPPPSYATPPESSTSTAAPGMGGADATLNTATPQAGNTMPGITTNGANGTQQRISGNNDARTDSTVSGDAQISEVVDAANNGEIAQAREALTKAKNARVKQFAQHMVTDHGAAESKLRALDAKNHITPQDSATSDQIKQGGDQVMLTLKSATGSDFDKSYIDAQVDQHQKVLDLLDKYIPQAQAPDLKTHLQEVRTKVAGHLKMAQDIQSALRNK